MSAPSTMLKLVRGAGEPVTTVVVVPHGTAVLLVLPEEMTCRYCQQTTRIAINRGGQTRCCSCDPGEPDAQPSSGRPEVSL
jgi:hypothetical protein